MGRWRVGMGGWVRVYGWLYMLHVGVGEWVMCLRGWMDDVWVGG